MLERAPVLREIGAGLTIWPNGVTALQLLGVSRPKTPFVLRRLKIVTREGQVLLARECSGFEARYGAPALPIHRAELHQMLLSTVGEDAEIVLGAEVTRFEQRADGVRVQAADGRSWTAGALVGADGIHSRVREQLLGDGPPRYTGVTVWRGVTAAESLRIPEGEAHTYLGDGGEFGFMPMLDGRVYWYATKQAPAGQGAEHGSHQADLRLRFSGWPGPIGQLVELTPEPDILRTDIYDRPPGRRWTVDRVTLLGDAAHPMTPHASQGACQALEDAVALGRSVQGGGDLAAAFAGYQQRRLRRANSFVRISSQTGRSITMRNPAGRWLRDQVLRRAPRSFLQRQMDAQFRLPA